MKIVQLKHLQLVLFVFIALACKEANTSKQGKTVEIHKKESITCTDNSCYGSYKGPEFVKGSDVAHQFSNSMSKSVGNKLKELYKLKKYSKVDFSSIKMTTIGMGTGQVTYALNIPFKKVENKCAAYTSFDHVGGWNHAPALNSRIKQLQSALLPGDTLDISVLKKTKEGLEEHWIQWRNKEKQKDCQGK